MHNVRSERRREFPCARLNHNQQTIQDIAQRMLRCEGQVVAGIQEHIDSAGDSATSAMSQNNDELQTAAQMLYGIFQAAQDVRAQNVACHSDDEEVVRAFAENKFDGHPRIRAAENRGEGMLDGRLFTGDQAQIAGIDRNNSFCPPLPVFDLLEQRSEGPVAFIETKSRFVAVGWSRSRRRICLISVDDVDRFHIGFLLRIS